MVPIRCVRALVVCCYVLASLADHLISHLLSISYSIYFLGIHVLEFKLNADLPGAPTSPPEAGAGAAFQRPCGGVEERRGTLTRNTMGNTEVYYLTAITFGLIPRAKRTHALLESGVRRPT